MVTYSKNNKKLFFKFNLFALTLMLIMLTAACSENEQEKLSSDTNNTSNPVIDDKIKNDNETENIEITKFQEEIDYQSLRYKITYSSATYADVLKSLTEKNVGGLTNTMHALYSMRWHRRVYRLLYDLWEMKKESYPDFAWEELEKPPVRIALASTIFRMNSLDTMNQPDLHKFKNFIREFKYDEHEFIRAQVIVSLGLAGDPEDVDYIKEMASGDNHYVTQSAITGLGLMNNKKASDALIEIYKKFKDDARSDLILEMLAKAYDLHPTNVPPEEQPKF